MGDHVMDGRVDGAADAAGQADLQPARRAVGQRGDDDLVIAARVPGLDDGARRVDVAEHALGFDARLAQTLERVVETLAETGLLILWDDERDRDGTILCPS